MGAEVPMRGPLRKESARNNRFRLRLRGREGVAQLRSTIQVSLSTT